MQAETITLSLADPPRPPMLTAPTRQHAEAPHGEADPRAHFSALRARSGISQADRLWRHRRDRHHLRDRRRIRGRSGRGRGRGGCHRRAALRPRQSLRRRGQHGAGRIPVAARAARPLPRPPRRGAPPQLKDPRPPARVAEILRAKGLSHQDAADAAQIFTRHPQVMAEMILAEETGLRDPDGESPARNGSFTFAAFITFGAVPLIPYLLFEATAATTRLSILATGVALVLLGLLRWHATGERLWRSVGETVLVGTVCAVVAFGVGWIVGG